MFVAERLGHRKREGCSLPTSDYAGGRRGRNTLRLLPQLEAFLAQSSACVRDPNRPLRSYARNHLDVNAVFAAKMEPAVHRPPKIVSSGCASLVPRRNHH